MRATTAVIPAAGLGTRFLPATKAIAKEMLPVVDKPAIQYVVEEAVRAGLDDLLLVTSSGKAALEDHFDQDPTLERQLEEAGKLDLLAVAQATSRLAQVTAVRQGAPKGLGHAVGCARRHVGDQPFAVLLPDDIIGAEEQLLADMVEVAEETGRTVVAVMEFGEDALDSYGVIAGEQDPDRPGVWRVTDMVEKPGRADAPSNLCIIGRYVLSPDIFDKIDATEPGRGGEIQLTDAMKAQIADAPIMAVRFDGVRYDVGAKGDYLRATVELAAQHHELGDAFRRFLVDYASRLPSA